MSTEIRKKHQTENYFLWALLAATSILAIFIFKPFLYPLILAAVFATVFSPVYKKAIKLTRQNRGLASLLCTLLVLVVVIVPVTFIMTQIIHEAGQVYNHVISDEGAGSISRSMEGVLTTLSNRVPGFENSNTDISTYANQGLRWFLPHLSSIVINVLQIATSIIIFLIALYYMFKDGDRLKKIVVKASPLDDVHDEMIFDKLGLAVNSVMKGNITVAVVQGILTGLGFLIFGIPNAVLWGTVAAVAALVPGFGTALVVVPGILYLLIMGSTGSALGLLVWGMVAVGLVDNVLGPILVRRGIHVHPFIILLSIFGGIGLFGPIGFFLGPLVMSLLFALIEIYSILEKEHGHG